MDEVRPILLPPPSLLPENSLEVEPEQGVYSGGPLPKYPRERPACYVYAAPLPS